MVEAERATLWAISDGTEDPCRVDEAPLYMVKSRC